MNIMEYLRGMKDRILGERKVLESNFDPEAVLEKFQGLPENGMQYLYYRTLPYAPANQLLNEVYVNLGRWTNAMEYDALLGGYGVVQLKYNPATGQVRGPGGVMRPPLLFQWNTPDGKPPAYLQEGRLVLRR
jgi:hypothetical protein